MSKTSTRLQKLVDEITEAKVIADIGTDHGYLPIMAVNQKKTLKAFASDIASEPLTSAKANVKEAKLDKRITCVLTDGLSYYADHNIDLDYAIIAGLGSLTISEILSKDYAGIKNYLLCSNTEPSAILKTAKKKHLNVVKEDYFIDKGRKYWLLNLSRTNGQKIKSFKDIYVGMNNVLTNKEYLDLLKKRFSENIKFMEHTSKWSKRYWFLKKLNKNIKEVLNNGTKTNY